MSGRTVTSKVMAILGAFEDGPPTLSLTEIAAFAQVPLPTAHRLVGELVEWGALRRDDTGRYRVGRRVWKIGQNAGRELRDSARRHLADLFALTGESCLLAIRDGEHALIIDRFYRGDQRGEEPTDRGPQAGDRLALHVSAVGRVLLAFEPVWIRDAYLARLGRPETPTPRRGAGDRAPTRVRRGRRERDGGLLGRRPGPGGRRPRGERGRPGQPDREPQATRASCRLLQHAARRIEPEAGNWPSTPAMVAAFTRTDRAAPGRHRAAGPGLGGAARTLFLRRQAGPRSRCPFVLRPLGPLGARSVRRCVRASRALRGLPVSGSLSL